MGFDNDLTGNKVKGYTVIGFAGNDSRRRSLWSCQCDKCHAIKIFRGDGILREEIAVCECKRKRQISSCRLAVSMANHINKCSGVPVSRRIKLR